MLLLLSSDPKTVTSMLLGILVLVVFHPLMSMRKQEKARPFFVFSVLASWIKKRINAWLFLVRGPCIIQDAYTKAKGAPFEVFVPENRYLFVSSKQHIKEIDAAPDTVLSLQAAAKQLLQPKYTMHNFNWFDRRGVDGTPLVRTLRTLLTNNVPEIIPNIRVAISELFDIRYEAQPVKNDKKRLQLYPMAIEAVSYSNAMAFFGTDLAHDKTFMKAAVDFIENTLFIAEIVRLLPNSIAPTIGKFLAARYKSHETLYAKLMPTAEKRLEERSLKVLGHKVPIHKDCIQWVMESSPRQKPWTAERIVHELMALWFGSVHIVSTTICFAVQDLCLHPEYIEPLRIELRGPQWAAFEKSGRGLPLLDSFIRESMRTTPTESMSTRRMALKPFALSDGNHVEVGEWICTPLRAMMRDSANYSSPLEFHGFRFVDPDVLHLLHNSDFHIPQPGKPSELTEVSNWQMWGTGRMACPGRYYAAAVMKTTLALFVAKYDCQLSNPEKSRWFMWRSFNYPKPSTTVDLRPC